MRRDLLFNHNDVDLFSCEDNMLFSRVKIRRFHAKAHLVFHWCLYNKQLLQETESKTVSRSVAVHFVCYEHHPWHAGTVQLSRFRFAR